MFKNSLKKMCWSPCQSCVASISKKFKKILSMIPSDFRRTCVKFQVWLKHCNKTTSSTPHLGQPSYELAEINLLINNRCHRQQQTIIIQNKAWFSKKLLLYCNSSSSMEKLINTNICNKWLVRRFCFQLKEIKKCSFRWITLYL